MQTPLRAMMRAMTDPNTAQQTRSTATLLALASGLCFSTITPFTRLTLESGVNSPSIVVWRYVIIALGMIALIAVTRRRWTITINPGAFTLACLGWFLVSVGHLGAVRYIPVSLAAIIFYTYPLMILLWRGVIDGQRYSWIQIAAFFIAFIGIVIALGPSFESLDWRGIALAIVGGIGSVMFILGSDRMPGDNDPLATVLWLTATNLPASLIWAISFETLVLPSGTGWIPMMIVGLSTVAALALLVIAIQRGGPALVGLMMNIEPVGIILLAVIFVGEKLDAPKVIGMLLVVCALVAAQLFDRGAKKKPEA